VKAFLEKLFGKKEKKDLPLRPEVPVVENVFSYNITLGIVYLGVLLLYVPLLILFYTFENIFFLGIFALLVLATTAYSVYDLAKQGYHRSYLVIGALVGFFSTVLALLFSFVNPWISIDSFLAALILICIVSVVCALLAFFLGRHFRKIYVVNQQSIPSPKVSFASLFHLNAFKIALCSFVFLWLIGFFGFMSFSGSQMIQSTCGSDLYVEQFSETEIHLQVLFVESSLSLQKINPFFPPSCLDSRSFGCRYYISEDAFACLESNNSANTVEAYRNYSFFLYVFHAIIVVLLLYLVLSLLSYFPLRYLPGFFDLERRTQVTLLLFGLAVIALIYFLASFFVAYSQAHFFARVIIGATIVFFVLACIPLFTSNKI
jgi:MFS family permease